MIILLVRSLYKGKNMSDVIDRPVADGWYLARFSEAPTRWTLAYYRNYHCAEAVFGRQYLFVAANPWTIQDYPRPTLHSDCLEWKEINIDDYLPRCQ